MVPLLQEIDSGSNGAQGRGDDRAAANIKLATSLPHGYLYTLELPRIHRMLRPVKAKIAAIHLAIKTAPSFGYTSNTIASRNSPTTTDSESDRDSSDSQPDNSRGAYAQNGQYQHQHRSLRSRHQFPHDYYSRSQSTAAAASTRQTSYDASTSAEPYSSSQSGPDTLVRRFQRSLTDQFKEVVEKTWWQPFCENYDLPLKTPPHTLARTGLKPERPTLGMECAFAVGRIVAHLNEADWITMEKYYNIMPAYMRRFALLEHLVELCLSQIPVGELIIPLVEVCARYHATYQALRLLQRLLVCQDTTFQLDLHWAYHTALRIECGDAWISSLIQSNRPSYLSTVPFQIFVRQARPRHRATLIRASFDIHMDRSLTSITDMVTLSRVSSWTEMLVEDSLGQHGQTAELSTASQCVGMSRSDDVIGYMAKYLCTQFRGDDNDDCMIPRRDWQRLRVLVLALVLHALYMTVTKSPVQENTGADEWINILEMYEAGGIRLSDFDMVVRSYGTLMNLNALALMLDAVGQYSLSMKLIDRILSDFKTLEKKTRQQLGYLCDVTVNSLEAYRREVRRRRIQKQSSDGEWVYDDMLGDWIERTPKMKKTSLFLFNTEEDQDRKDPSDKRDRRNRQRVFRLDDSECDSDDDPPTALSYCTSDASEFSSPNQRQQSSDIPLTVPRGRVRYSLTPIRRSVRSNRRCVSYNDSDSWTVEEELEDEDEIAGAETAYLTWQGDANAVDTEVVYSEDDNEEEENRSEQSEFNGIDLDDNSSNQDSSSLPSDEEEVLSEDVASDAIILSDEDAPIDTEGATRYEDSKLERNTVRNSDDSEDGGYVNHEMNRPYRVRGLKCSRNTHYSQSTDSDEDFVPARRNGPDSTVKLQEGQRQSQTLSPSPQQVASARKGRVPTSSSESENWLLSNDSQDSGFKEPSSQSTENSVTRLRSKSRSRSCPGSKATRSIRTRRHQSLSRSSSESDFGESASKNKWKGTQRRKRIRIEDSDESFTEFGGEDDDADLDQEHGAVSNHANDFEKLDDLAESQIEELWENGHDEEEDDVESDETMSLHEEELVVNACPPLPLTGPDELAFWI
ncbi:hypothetical protein BGZ51_002666 [Haplosporangium sp. Z 767]|nr:hypothetical protein BGZ51_002666 [Haplosporangium sp. Z 767]